MISRSGKVPGL